MEISLLRVQCTIMLLHNEENLAVGRCKIWALIYSDCLRQTIEEI